jgi:uncharacterized protein
MIRHSYAIYQWRNQIHFEDNRFDPTKKFIMIGILVELLFSFLLLRLFQKRGLNALGLSPDKQRFQDLLAGFLLPVAFTVVLQYTLSVLVQNPWRVNPYYTFRNFIGATGYVLRSVLFEDLLFRGALLYVLMQRIGPVKAVWISAVFFGIYHWFSWGVLGNPIQMVVVFLMTGSAGYVFALAFSKTGSMYLPFALHFGIDLAAMVLFSQDKGIGPQLLVKTFAQDPHVPGAVISLLWLVLHYTGFPILCLFWLRSRVRKIS